jgi:hypothetical protein
MNIGRYLPSAQFMVIVGSIALSGGLVLAAQQYTHPLPANPSLATAPTQQAIPTGDWLAALQDIEGSKVDAAAQNTEPDAQTLLDAAVSSNVTDTVARTLLVNLSAAKAQGLGSDIPTQDKLIAQAASQIPQGRNAPAYTNADLTLSPNTPAAQKAYGNAVISAVAAHPDASYNNTLYAIGTSTDNNNAALLSMLAPIGKDYDSLARALVEVPVPPVLAPLHLQIINNLAAMAGTYADLQAIFADPLRGLAGFQLYQALNDETSRLFINIAQEFNQNGILFNKDEAGYAWPMLLSPQSQ